jgi:hypothetical protein
MKVLITIATIALISASAHAGSWGFTLSNGAGFYSGNNQNNCNRSYHQQPTHQVYYPSRSSYVTPPVYIKTDLYAPPVIMQRAVYNSPQGYSSYPVIQRPCSGYPNRW